MRRVIRAWSHSTQIATPSFMVTASGCAPPMPPSPAVTVIVPASVPPEALVGHGGEGLEGALQDALGADVDPGAGGHLPVHRQPEVLQAAELLPVGPVADQVGVRDQHPRRPLVGPQHADRLAALHEQRLVVSKVGQGADDRVVGRPGPGRLAGAAVDHEVVGVFGVLGVEVVHQHPQRRLGLPGLRGQLGCRAAAAPRGVQSVMRGLRSCASTARTSAPLRTIVDARARSRGPGAGPGRGPRRCGAAGATAARGGRRRARAGRAGRARGRR